jgi:NitT/TauT family transport system permease protein
MREVAMATTLEPQEAQRAPSAEELRLRATQREETQRRWFWRIAGYVVFLGLWELASPWIMSEDLLPGPMRILRTFPEIIGSGRFLLSFGATLTRIGVGFGCAFVGGALVGLLAQSRWFSNFFRDAVTIGLTAPGLIWALIGLVIWGFKPQGWIFAIFLATFAIVTVNVAEGIRALPKDLLDMAKAFGTPLLRRQRHIVIPHLAPYIFTAIRFGFSIAWKITVLTEVFSSNKGIGFEMRVSSQLFALDEFFTWVLSFFVFALFLEKVVLQRFERKFFRWRQEVSAA